MTPTTAKPRNEPTPRNDKQQCPETTLQDLPLAKITHTTWPTPQNQWPQMDNELCRKGSQSWASDSRSPPRMPRNEANSIDLGLACTKPGSKIQGILTHKSTDSPSTRIPIRVSSTDFNKHCSILKALEVECTMAIHTHSLQRFSCLNFSNSAMLQVHMHMDWSAQAGRGHAWISSTKFETTKAIESLS